ncbi:Gfo/Idh/MocA family protein [Virgibacillus siamensis]|uniref:Gfo/Idh/MocA family protein n=1 Tax=Virgibacillus siamensis TaxID=480071 RepID=UPI00098517FB|nr:Gfo/Idh/MocA family oxidoreductase [Virgibacillus siamensis]
MGKLRIGIIGAGGIAEGRHLPAFQTMQDRVTLQAVHDINEVRARQVAELYSIPDVFGDYGEMFRHVDAVVICTPNKFHSEIAIAALKRGVHVFCEKPMAITAAECRDMIEAADKAGKVLTIGYHYRFMQESRAAKAIVDAGDIGEPIVARVKALRRRKVPGWGVFTNKELQGGGSLIDYGCHFLDLALWLMGNPDPIEISGTTYNHLSKTPGLVNEWGNVNHATFDVDDHATAYIKFANGSSLLFETSWAANVKEDIESVSISGTSGGLDLFPLEVNQEKNGMLLNSEPYWLPGKADPGIPQAKAFVNSCLGLDDVLVKPEEALQVSTIIESIYESSFVKKK